jgi:hypothetical protein
MQEIESTTEDQGIKDSEEQREVEQMDQLVNTSDKIGSESDKQGDDVTIQETEQKTENQLQTLEEVILSDPTVTSFKSHELSDLEQLQVGIIHSTQENFEVVDDEMEQAIILQDNSDDIQIIDQKEQEVQIREPSTQNLVEDQGPNDKISDIATLDESKWPKEGMNR